MIRWLVYININKTWIWNELDYYDSIYFFRTNDFIVGIYNNIMMLKFYLWLMGWSGTLSAWAFRKQAAIVREHNRKEEQDYLKELKKKL